MPIVPRPRSSPKPRSNYLVCRVGLRRPEALALRALPWRAASCPAARGCSNPLRVYSSPSLDHPLPQVVGAVGFEPTTSSSQSWRTTRLCYAPFCFMAERVDSRSGRGKQGCMSSGQKKRPGRLSGLAFLGLGRGLVFAAAGDALGGFGDDFGLGVGA